MFGGTHAVFDGGPSMRDDNDLTDGKAQEPNSRSETWGKPSSLCFLSFCHLTRPEQFSGLGHMHPVYPPCHLSQRQTARVC